jgi:hypothetical protein
MCLAVNFSYVKLGMVPSFTTYSYHRTEFLLYDYRFDGMDGTFYDFSLYTTYNKLILDLDFCNNRYVSSLPILDLKNILFINISDLVNYCDC